MLLLAIGAKGGVGTTALVQALVRSVGGVGLDLTDDRQLTARLDRLAFPLDAALIASESRRRKAVQRVVRKRMTLLWTPECVLDVPSAIGFIRAVASNAHVVADGGIGDRLPDGIAEAADAIVVVTAAEADGDLKTLLQHHIQRLKQLYPQAITVVNEAETVETLAQQLKDT